MQNDKDILKAIAGGSETAFEQLFNTYFHELCRFAYVRFLYDEAECEEIVENVFIKIWEIRENLTDIGSIKAYLFKAVANACINYLEHQKVKKRYINRIQQELIEIEIDGYNNVEELEEISSKLLIEIEYLPEQTRKIFILKYVEGRKYKEIAEQLNISVKTVETLIYRGLKNLRNKFFSA